MAELSTSPEQTVEGQAASAPEGTTGAAPNTGTDGQAGTEGSAATGQATAPEAEESFFDPKTVPPELQAAYKQMQGSYTRKMQAIAEKAKAAEQKIQAYDAFTADPVTAMQQLAAQYGMTITRAEAKRQVEAQQDAQEDWQPQSWDEVMTKATERAKKELLKELGPVLSTVQRVQAEGIERQLDEADPTWREYEEVMQDNLRKYPQMAGELDKLLAISLPRSVLEGRAMQKALKQLEGRAKSAAVGGKSTTRASAPATNEKLTFDESVQRAREQLAKG